MAKNNYLDYSETSNWNIAKNYSESMILIPLQNIQSYETICIFGTLEMIDQFQVDENTKNMARIMSLERYLQTLELLISNARFAVKKDDKLKLDELGKKLKKVLPALPMIKEHGLDQKNKKNLILINEEVFHRILNMLIKIKVDLLEPLNSANLIFTSNDSLDPDELVRKMKEDMIFSG